MRLLICGSRSWMDRQLIKQAIIEWWIPVTVIIHGGARGADTLAGEIAEELKIPTEVYLPDLEQKQSVRRVHSQSANA